MSSLNPGVPMHTIAERSSGDRRVANALRVSLLLTFLPFVMNAYPAAFAYAYSERADRWSSVGIPIMAATTMAWMISLVHLWQVLQQWTPGRSFSFGPLSFSWAERADRTSVLRIGFFGKYPCTFAGFLAAIPVAASLLFVAFILIAAFQVGHWPVYGQPDPKSVGPGLFGEFMQHTFAALIFIIPAAFVCLLLATIVRISRTPDGDVRCDDISWPWREIGVFVVGAAVFAVVLISNLNWFLD